jgi:hypothetical protein
MKSTPRTLGRSITHHEPEMHVYRVLDFSLLVYRGFGIPFFGFPATRIFGAILIWPFVLGSFRQFRTLLGPDFKGNFQSTFGRGFLEEFWLKVVVELRLEVVVEFPLIHIAITVVVHFPGPL